MLRHLREVANLCDSPGLKFTRLATDIFEIAGPLGSHHCIASVPQGSSLRALQEYFPAGKLPKLLVKPVIHRLLFSLNWLHGACGVIHCGKPDVWAWYKA